MSRVILYDDCETETGFTAFKLLHLTGVFGIHDVKEFNDLYATKKLNYKFYFDDDDDFFVDIISPAIIKLRVRFIFPDEMYIDLFRLNPSFKGANVGFNRMRSQVEAAKTYSFTRITLWAYGNIKEFKNWDGYIIWGKYGFSMYEPREKHSFNSKMTEDRLIHCSTINDLVYSKEGTAYWKHRGEDWHGEFIMDDNSHNMNVFRRYGEERGLF